MKTAISLPDRLYKDAEKTAKSLGIPRSQLFAKALQEFISHHTKENVTESLNKVYSNTTLSSDLTNTENVTIESIRELTKNDTW
jgi:metal-responsive CopG/Arc/MetJ family transcriptional regulator